MDILRCNKNGRASRPWLPTGHLSAISKDHARLLGVFSVHTVLAKRLAAPNKMSLVWTFVFYVLMVELFVLALLVLPLPWGVRKNIARSLMNPQVKRIVDRVLQYLGVGLMFAVAESVHALRHLQEVSEATRLPSDQKTAAEELASTSTGLHELKWRRALAQRNLYLSSFSLVLIVTLLRIINLVRNETALRQRIKELNGNQQIDDKGFPVQRGQPSQAGPAKSD